MIFIVISIGIRPEKPSVVSRVPSIVYQELPGAGWSEMSEVRLD